MSISEAAAQKNLKNNLKYIMEENRITTRKELAASLDISEPMLSRIMNDGQIPTMYPFFAMMNDKYGYTVEECLFTDLAEMQRLQRQNDEGVSQRLLGRYLGLYQIYHFRTTSLKGRDISEAGAGLRSGILFICRNPQNSSIHQAYALFDLGTAEADEIYSRISDHLFKDGDDAAVAYLFSLRDDIHLYLGDLEITSWQVFCNLRYDFKDRVTIMFHQVEGTSKDYIGSLAAMLSVSKGRMPMPCFQYLGISRYSLAKESNDVISHYLLAKWPRTDSSSYLEEIANLTEKLYSQGREGSSRSDDEKHVMLLYYLDMVANQAVEKNIRRLQLLTIEEDDAFYHFLRACINNRSREA